MFKLIATFTNRDEIPFTILKRFQLGLQRNPAFQMFPFRKLDSFSCAINILPIFSILMQFHYKSSRGFFMHLHKKQDMQNYYAVTPKKVYTISEQFPSLLCVCLCDCRNRVSIICLDYSLIIAFVLYLCVCVCLFSQVMMRWMGFLYVWYHLICIF